MTTNSWGRLLGYIGCALGIFVASSTAALLGVALGCASLIAQDLDG